MEQYPSQPARRNVVMIICDTLRPDFLSAYKADFIPTPHIDALCENGMVFENAITASTVCAPARASMVTGLPVSAHDGWTNQVNLKEGVEYYPERLNKAGYMTAAVGCYDHAPYANPIGHRYLKTFDENRPGSEYLSFLKSRHPEVTTAFSPDPEDPTHFAYPEEEHYDHWCADCAIDFINSYSNSFTVPEPGHLTGAVPDPKEKAPFFLYCGFLSPHEPHLPPKEMKGRIDPAGLPPIWKSRRDEDLPSVERNRRAFLNDREAIFNPESVEEERQRDRVTYCEMICEIDDQVGRIVSALKQNGIYENTAIIFTADHGSMENDYCLSTKGPYPYTPQLFIPLILSNVPGLRGRSDCLCGNIDIGATLLDIAGDHKAFGLSRSLIGMAKGETPRRKSILSEFCDSCKTIVTERYTFTYYPFTGKTALYDRKNDPKMAVDLSENPEYTVIKSRLLTEIIDWLILGKGVRIEAHDLVPDIQEGIREKLPEFLDHFDICYPLASEKEAKRVQEAGLPWDYDEFCRDHPIRYQYGNYASITPPEK